MDIMKQNIMLAYADYIVIIGSSRIEVKISTTDLLKAAKPMDLRINQERTIDLVVSRGMSDEANFLIDGYVVYISASN